MITGLLGALAVLLRPDAAGAEVLLAAGLLAALLAVSVIARVSTTSAAVVTPAAVDGFAELRVLLRASRPDAAGHRRARAPGSTR